MVELRHSSNVDVGTPREFFDGVTRLFGAFDLDVCCNPPLTEPLAPRFYTPIEDGLAQPWTRPEIVGRPTRVWCNPPYDNEGAWMLKAATEAAFSVVFVPAKTSMAWWRLVTRRAAILLFVQGRMKFVGMKWDAPFASALVVFDPVRKEGPPLLGHITKKGQLV